MKIQPSFLVCLFVLFIALSVTHLQAAPQHGANGAAGTPGQPGGNGGNGTDLMSVRPSVGAPFSWIVQGFNGGNGGRGGDGFIWNANPEDSTAGMTGGNGGRGGHTGAIWTPMITIGPDGPIYQRSVYVEAVAGNGGAGGLGGNGFQGGRVGNAGNGGNGGSAHAMAYGGFDVTARAVGGLGGAANGLDGRGGDGGHASASVSLINTQYHSTSSPAKIWMMTVGGGGGDGLDRSRGGDGGTALLGGHTSNYRIQSSGFNVPDVWLETVGRGGNGGNSVGARGGAGGHSIVELSSMLSSQRYESNFYSSLSVASATFNLHGGRGGNSLDHHLVSGHGGTGGSVALHSGFGITPSVVRNVNITARGGRGGDALGRFGGHGGLGGAINVGQLVVGGGDLNIQLRGGDGGHSRSENAGAGRTVTFENRLNYIAEQGNSRYNITIQGGDGGNLLGSNTMFQGTPRVAGNGGSAVATSFHQLPYLFGRENEVRVIGGWAGRGIAPAGTERAGDAIVNFREIVLSAGSLSVIADGGRSFQRTNGAARAIVDLQAADNVFGAITASATARPYLYVDGPRPIPQARFGGSAWAEAFARRSDALGLISSTANAESSFGTVQSGGSRALATAVNTTTNSNPHGVFRGRDAVASATAISRADGSTITPNHAISRARAISNFFGEATASSLAQGQYNYARATAELQAPRGSAIAMAQGETSQWFHQSQVTSSAYSHSPASQPVKLGASAFSSFRHTEIAGHEPASDFGTRAAWNHILINPGELAVNDFTSVNPFIDEKFDFGTKSSHVGDILLIGSMGGGPSASPNVAGDFQVQNRIDLTLHLFPSVQDTGELSVAFFNPLAYGDGFESLSVAFDYQGTNILDVHFTDLVEARDFFTNQIISLDDLVMPEGLERHFSLQFDMRFSQTGTTFGFDFLVGNQSQMASFNGFSSVPEPTMLPALLGLAAAMLLRRRRQ